MVRRAQDGFTLAELLIALGVLGVIATFTIPKILASQLNAKYSAEAKEVAASISAAFLNEYNANGGDNWVDDQDAAYGWGSGLTAFVPNKLSYVSYLTSGTMTYPLAGATSVYGGQNVCNVGQCKCYQLHNGGVLWWVTYAYAWDGQYWQMFFFDPDGTGPVESLPFVLVASSRGKFKDPNGQSYAPGRVMTFAELSHISWGGYGSANPSWFSW